MSVGVCMETADLLSKKVEIKVSVGVRGFQFRRNGE